jgi:hypothetical protein
MLFRNVLMVAVALISWLYNPKKIAKGAEGPLARVYDKYLYPNDLNFASLAANREDSLGNYIESWASRWIVIEQAKKGHNYTNLKIEKKVEDYKNDLIYHTFMQSEINRRLSKITISDEEINDYYKKNEGNFRTSNTLVLVRAIKCRGELPSNIVTKLSSNSTSDQEFVRSYLNTTSNCYFLKDNEWILLDELIKETDHNLYTNLQSNKNRLLVMRNAGHMYYLNIKDYRLVGQVAPLEFVKDSVVSFLIHIKKNDLHKKIESELIKKAIDNGEYSVYKK